MEPTAAASILDDVVAQAPELTSVPGIAYGLVHVGKRGVELVHAAGTGSATIGGPPPGPDTVFRIASMTKSFTAAAALLLRDRGHLRLDEPVATYVPAAATIGAPITIRDLLTMNSGLPTDDPWGDRQESLPTKDFDALVAGGLSFCRPPRTGFEYSNTGYALLGRVIEVASGESYHSFVLEHLCAPLGLAATRFDPADIPSDRLATGYRVPPDGAPIAERLVRPGAYSAMGGLHSSLRDLAVWVGGFLRSWTDDPPDHPVDRWSLREAQEVATFVGLDDASEPGTGTGASGYGYGLYAHHDRVLGRVVSHSGGYPGFGSHMRWHPGSGWGVIVLGNATYTPAHISAANALARIVEESGAAHAARPPVPVRPWPRTVAAVALADDLVRGRTDAVPSDLWAPNMDLDVPRAERLAALQVVRDTIGLSAPDADRPERLDVTYPTPAQAVWTLTGPAGTARVELQMSPEKLPRIQGLVVLCPPPAVSTISSHLD